MGLQRYIIERSFERIVRDIMWSRIIEDIMRSRIFTYNSSFRRLLEEGIVYVVVFLLSR